MRALSYDRFGPLDVLHLADLPEPRPGPGQVLVSMRASTVNVIDNRVRAGMMGILVRKTFPKIPGADVAGVVKAMGPGVTGFAIGEEVFGALDPFVGGAFAEAAIVPVAQLAAKPAGLSFEQAATLPIAGNAALTAVRDLGRARQGGRVLVHGGSGAVGLYAIPIAKRLGAHVTAVGGASGVDAMAAAGADIVIDYRKPEGGKLEGPFDLILNASGAMPFAKGEALLAPGGVLVEPSPSIPVVLGSMIGNLFRGRKHRPLMAKPSARNLALLAQWATDGTLRPVIARVFPLADAREALGLMEQGGVVGKVVVTMGR
jgi:NADPH:quinone reductase-like Zn-dependent oxidoreductase